MKLDRNNYEEFFLLYVDNELSDTERKKVETFILENPDLREELNLLQSSKIQPETSLFFENKTGLLKQAAENSIQPAANLEELFLLYADQELDEAGRKSVEEITAKNPSLKKDLQMIQQTRLLPDLSVVFARKEILLKKEESVRFVWLSWPKLSAAAVLLFVAVIFLFEHPKTGKAGKVGAPKNLVKSAIQNNEKKNLPTVTAAAVDSLYQLARGSDKSLAGNKIQNQVQVPKKNHPLRFEGGKKENTNGSDVHINPPSLVKIQENQRELPEISPSKDLSSPVAVKTNTALELEPALFSADQVAKATNPVVRKGLQADTENSSDPEDGILMSSPSENKNRMRGFFRKVSRVLDQTISVDPEHKKRGLRIGNYQIALR
jgi:hypothetical protein